MSYEADIYAAVQASTALVALIGDRFSWDVADGNTIAPYIVAQTISDGGETDLSGGRAVSFPLIQVSCWARTKAESIAIAQVWKQEMEGRNLSGDSNVSLSFANRNSSHDRESRLFGEILDYRASVTLT